jgi:hypothetical protein
LDSCVNKELFNSVHMLVNLYIYVFYQHSPLALHLYYVYSSQLELPSTYIHNELKHLLFFLPASLPSSL